MVDSISTCFVYLLLLNKADSVLVSVSLWLLSYASSVPPPPHRQLWSPRGVEKIVEILVFKA